MSDPKEEKDESAKKQHKPSIGRVVHYTTGRGEVLPAFVTSVKSDSLVNLHVFSDAGGKLTPSTYVVANVVLSEDGKPDSWAWPKKV